MSDGGIGNGIVFWATINIRGELKQKQLKDVTNAIRQVMNDKGVNGDIIHSVRLTAAEQPVLSISMKESGTHKKKRMKKGKPPKPPR